MELPSVMCMLKLVESWEEKKSPVLKQSSCLSLFSNLDTLEPFWMQKLVVNHLWP